MLPEPLLEVVTPASSFTLADLATLKGDLGITDSSLDTRLQRIIKSVSQRIPNYIGRPIVEQTYRQTWRMPAGGQDYWSVTLPRDQINFLDFRRMPVTVITSVSENGTTLDPSLYSWIDDKGLQRLNASGGQTGWASGLVVGTYVAGWMPIGTSPTGAQVALPDDLVEAALMACRADFYAKDRDPGQVVKSEQVPEVYMASYDTRTGEGDTIDGGPGTYGLPAAVRGILDAYRRSTFAY